MKVARITTAVLEANYDWTIVRVRSDDGLSGWGEAFCAPGLAETIRELAPLVEGRDARHVEPLVRRLHLATAHSSSGGTVYHAISGIEAALWDLVARRLEVPLWQLFGGCFRDRVRIYADCHAGTALTSYSATLVSRRLPWMQEAVEELALADDHGLDGRADRAKVLGLFLDAFRDVEDVGHGVFSWSAGGPGGARRYQPGENSQKAVTRVPASCGAVDPRRHARFPCSRPWRMLRCPRPNDESLRR